MFKKRAVDLGDNMLHSEQCLYDAICRLSSARAKATSNQVKWASGESNVLFLTLFKKLAEIQWMYNEATKEMAEKHLELSKTLKKVFQEERHLEESRKDLLGTAAKITKLQKQVEYASRKGDHIKAQSLEAELFTHTTLSEQLSASIETRSNKLELNKLCQLKKALVVQAEGVITLSGHCQQLYASQMQLIDLLPDTPLESQEQLEEVDVSMASVVSKVSQLLSMSPPSNGGIDLKITGTDNTRPHPPKSPRPEVDYTQGMYCEIVIPEPGARRSPPTVHRPSKPTTPPASSNGGVPMRRCQSGQTPVLDRKVQTEKHRSAVIMDKQEPMPLKASYGLNTSSEALDDTEDLVEQGYSKISIVPLPESPTLSTGSSSASPELDSHSGYAKPADVVPFHVFTFKDQQKRCKQKSPSSPEAKSVSHYETIDNIQKLKKEQKSEANKPKYERSPDYEPIYSAPFDSISGNCPLKVSQECTKDQLSIPPQGQKHNGKAYPNEKSVKSIYNIQPNFERSSSSPSCIARGTKERSSKKFKIAPKSPPAVLPTSEVKPHYIVELENRTEKKDSENDKCLERTSGSCRQKVLPVAETVNKLRTGHASVMKPPLPASRNK